MPLPSNPQGLEGRLNALAVSLMNQFNAKMPTFLTGHGWYFQGIGTADKLPANGEEVVPDLSRHPHYQSESWADLGINFPATIECAVSVWNYDGPNGKDWQLRLGVEINGVPWIRTFSGNGTEAASTGDWVPVEPSIEATTGAWN